MAEEMAFGVGEKEYLVACRGSKRKDWALLRKIEAKSKRKDFFCCTEIKKEPN